MRSRWLPWTVFSRLKNCVIFFFRGVKGKKGERWGTPDKPQLCSTPTSGSRSTMYDRKDVYELCRRDAMGWGTDVSYGRRLNAFFRLICPCVDGRMASSGLPNNPWRTPEPLNPHTPIGNKQYEPTSNTFGGNMCIASYRLIMSTTIGAP